tara:strand:+ start:114 stop:302 length:189 start_codon:yes stop_codon:yes gene_type:complete
MANSKSKIDKFLGHFVSKKLSVFIISSIFVGLGYIEPSQWVNISMIYIGGQSVVDSMAKLRK